MNNSFYLMEGVVLSLECIVLVDRPLWIGLFISESVTRPGSPPLQVHITESYKMFTERVFSCALWSLIIVPFLHGT